MRDILGTAKTIYKVASEEFLAGNRQAAEPQSLIVKIIKGVV